MSITPELKRFYAEEVRAIGALPDSPMTERVLDVFATVPREKYAGTGPWLLRSPLPGMASRRTPNTDPKYLYHNVLIALDEEQGINIGEPSLWARLLSQTSIVKGACVLQVGAGSGYYTAILAELVGRTGKILATETDSRLASMAINSLSDINNVVMKNTNGATGLSAEDGPFDLIIAFAGVTHPAQQWIERLTPKGQLLLPVTGESWQGAMILADEDSGAFKARTLGRCGFFPCVGARDTVTAGRVDDLWSKESRLSDSTIGIRFEDGRVVYESEGQLF